MKLVAALCPNCKSNLKVNPKKEAIKCEYCGSAILVEEAVETYKLELTGEVEIKNLPKIENYLKLGDRHYKNKNYEEAYENYGKVIELDPNNKDAILKYGICKTLLNNYVDFSLEYLINSFNEIVDLSEGNNKFKENKERYVNEVAFAADESLNATRVYYNSYTMRSDDLINIQNKLISILYCYETILPHTEESKEYIIKQIISVLKDLLKDKIYKTGSSVEGYNFLETYKTSISTKSMLIAKLTEYEKTLNPNYEGYKEKKSDTETESKKETDKWLIIVNIFLWAVIIESFNSYQLLSALSLICISIIISSKKANEFLFKNDKARRKRALIFLIIIWILSVIVNGIAGV